MKNKQAQPRTPRLSLKKESLQKLSDSLLAQVQGAQMNLNPRTDCICCKACATNVC